jgi:hypothetical protein
LEASGVANAVDFEFVLRVLRTVAFDNCGDLWWRTDGEYAPVTFLVECSDVFWWGTADCEQVTPENVDAFEQAYRDAGAADKDYGLSHGGALFCARTRALRPQGAAYPEEQSLWPLFDACGPEREVGTGNPRPHPSKRHPKEAG